MLPRRPYKPLKALVEVGRITGARVCYMPGLIQPAQASASVQDADSDVSVPAVYNSDGVDLSLVRSMLAKTPTERLQAVQDVIDLLTSAKRAGPR